MNDLSFDVCVECYTYNQAIYINDALDGFCMQQTDFPFVCTIIDDASIDGEQEVISKYLHDNFDIGYNGSVLNQETDDYSLTFAKHKTNNNCFFVVIFLKYNHYQIKKPKMPYIAEWEKKAKYIAICEGDDYWTNPMKLQKQFAFMERHPRHSLCFCAHETLSPNGETKKIYRYANDIEECPMQDIIWGGGGFMSTNSMFYRNNMYVHYSIWAKGCPVGDLPAMLTLATKGFVGYIADVMCVHRVSSQGSWTSRMSSDKKAKKRHYHAIVRMWHQYDKYTNFKYHTLIMKKIWRNRKNFIREYYGGFINKLLGR